MTQDRASPMSRWKINLIPREKEDYYSDYMSGTLREKQYLYKAVKKNFAKDGWNHIHIIVKNKTLICSVNGVQTLNMTIQDRDFSPSRGHIAFSPKGEFQIKNFGIKELEPNDIDTVFRGHISGSNGYSKPR